MTDLILITLVSVAVWVGLIGLVRALMRRRFGGLEGHHRMVHLFMVLMGLAVAIYLAELWGFIQFLVGSVAAAGSMGVIVGFSLVPWLNDAFVGLSLYLDQHIRVGTEIEIGGKRGRVIEMSLTRTKISGDECIYVVSNRKFREEIVTIISRGSLPSLAKRADGNRPSKDLQHYLGLS